MASNLPAPTALRGYAKSISEATGVIDPRDLAEIEDTMRNDVFHSTLDWQSRDIFHRGAKAAWSLIQFLRSPSGEAEMAALEAEMLQLEAA